MRRNTRAKTLLLAALSALCLLCAAPEARDAVAAVVSFDALGRLTNPEETFRYHNPSRKGKKNTPIPEVDAYDLHGFPPLMRAVSAGNKEEVLRLLRKKANPNVRNAYGRMPLEAASDRGNLEIAALLITYGAKASLGAPLHYAATPQMQALLKKHGAKGTTPSPHQHVRVTGHNDARVLERLLAEEKKSGKQHSSIPIAVMLGRSQEEIGALLARGSDINEAHPEYGTALHQSIFQGRDADFFAFLLRSGANPNLPSKISGLPLDHALDKGKEDLVLLLLNSGANGKNSKKKPEKTVFHKAVEKGMLETVRRMLAAGADPNERVRDSQGRATVPPLFLSESPAMLRLLLASGANPKAEDHRGYNALAALDWETANIPAALLLLEAGVSGRDSSIVERHGASLIFWALRERNHELFQAARKAGVSVNERDDRKGTALLEAVSRGDVWFTRELLSAGAKVKGSATYPGQRYVDYERSYAATDDLLAKGVQSGNLEVVRLLLGAGVSLDVKANEYDQGTALHLAVTARRPDLVAALLQAGAKTNVSDRYGRTPLHLAADEGKVEVVKLLLKAGANPLAKDDDGESPLDIAKERRNPESIRLMERR